MSDLMERLVNRFSKNTANPVKTGEYSDLGSLVVNGIDLRSKEEEPCRPQFIPEVNVIVRVRPSAGYYKSVTRRRDS